MCTVSEVRLFSLDLGFYFPRDEAFFPIGKGWLPSLVGTALDFLFTGAGCAVSAELFVRARNGSLGCSFGPVPPNYFLIGKHGRSKFFQLAERTKCIRFIQPR